MSCVTNGVWRPLIARHRGLISTAVIIFAVLNALSSLAPHGYAQQAATTTLSGRVLDPNGAVIPGAKVAATQIGTGVKRETT
ncbi:MAG: carboxypeptidase-like regulatory domain-containing protein, partial [Acidobacteriota bacterium]